MLGLGKVLGRMTNLLGVTLGITGKIVTLFVGKLV